MIELNSRFVNIIINCNLTLDYDTEMVKDLRFDEIRSPGEKYAPERYYLMNRRRDFINEVVYEHRKLITDEPIFKMSKIGEVQKNN